jgi:hypothetical protein
MKIECVTVVLKEDQIYKIGPMIEIINSYYRKGNPGMLLAQIFNGQMKVFTATHEQALKIQEAMGSTVGLKDEARI